MNKEHLANLVKLIADHPAAMITIKDEFGGLVDVKMSLPSEFFYKILENGAGENWDDDVVCEFSAIDKRDI